MYRLLKLTGTPLQKYPKVSLGSLGVNSELNISEKTCELCGISCISYVRNQSTITNPSINLKTRKKKKNRKNYAELLVVTETSSHQKRASVQKLNSIDLKLLATTNLNLSELYKLKELTKNTKFVEQHTYNNLNVIENLPVTGNVNIDDLDPFGVNEKDNDDKVLVFNIPNKIPLKDDSDSQKPIEKKSIELERAIEMDLESIRVVNTFQPEVIEETLLEVEENKESLHEKPNRAYLDLKYREEVSLKTLASYIEVCSHLKSPQRGLNALHFHKTRQRRFSDKSYMPVRSIKVYNALLKGFAHKASLEKVQEILKIMEEEHVEPNLQSFIAIFECLGRVDIDDNHLKDIRIFAKKALAKGFTFDNMLNNGCFLKDERNMVLKVMKSYDPNYVPTYYRPVINYQNHLVNHLNTEIDKEMLKNQNKTNKEVIFKATDLTKSILKQVELEKNCYVSVKSIEVRGKPTDEVLNYRQVLDAHFKIWEEAALDAFNRDLSTLAAQRSALNMEPYLRCIPARDYVAVIVDEAKKIAQGSETYSPTVNMLYRDMGSRVYARYKVLRKQKMGVLDKITKIHEEYCKHYAQSHVVLEVLPLEENKCNSRQVWQLAEHSFCDEDATLNMDHQDWTPTTLQFVGKFLYHIVMHDIKIDVNSMRINTTHKNLLPAFYTIFRTQGRITKEEVKPHPVLSRLYRASKPETLTFPAYELPMLCPPVPWTSTNTGGYLVSPCDVIRLPLQATSQKLRLHQAGPQQLYPSLDALNQLASVPWMVNQKILDVILEVFNSGGSATLDVPEPPTSLQPPAAVSVELDKTEKYNLFRQKLQYKRKKAEMYSLWCDCLYRLSLANHFRDNIFWLPHNMDFRGRVYPIPPHLNHLGSDLARSMLVFAESRPLGPHGLDWLKVHLINLTGLKKRDPVSERLKFANKNMDLILDSADNPLTGKKWWADSDEPWQTLACCMEIADVVRSGDPENYRSHFPIHQDGSCNGLQHYAALGRDSAGAHSVNLTPSECPQDVYSAVVALVEEQRARDAENGVEIAKILEGFVKRKVIKQTVMTTVYGVTRFGARLQIAKQLKDINDFPKDSVWAASSYLTGRTFDSLRTMFTSTREIQDWFTECARLISSVGGQYVEWVTPLGLPIVQPYFKYKKLGMPSVYEFFSIDKYEKPNVMKQKNAFPPNFIHSLDSSHMMLTSLHCEQAGITFVSVHDCYWTHPSTVEIMNKICRDQFVALHSEPILENLSFYLSEKYSYDESDLLGDGSVTDLTKKKLNRVLKQLPKKGNFDITQVLKSVYFFS